MLTPARSSSSSLSASSALRARSSATPPPATMPSSTAARVACMASSTRAFFSFISTYGRRADADHGHAADPLGEALLQLLAVVIRGRFLDLGPELLDAALDVGLLAGAVDQRRVVLVDHDPLAAAELLQRDVLELQPELLGDQAAAGEDRDVLEHGLAPVAEAGRLHRAAGERAPNLVDDQRCQCLALDFLGDDEERLPGARHLLQQREQVLHDRDPLLVDQDVGVLEHRLHPIDVGHEVGGEVAAVELHALDDLELGVEALGLLDGDDALLSHLLHRLGDQVADGAVAVGRHDANLGDLGLALGRFGELLQLLDDRRDGPVDATLETHRVVAGRHQLRALGEKGPRQHGGRRRAVARHVGGLRGDLLHHLRAHVLELVGELDLLRDRHAVLGDGGGAPRLLEHHVSPARPQRHRDRIGEDVDAAQHLGPRVRAEQYQLARHRSLLLSLDDAEDVLLAEDQALLAVELDLGAGVLAEQYPVTGLHVEGQDLAVLLLTGTDRYG